MVPGKLTGSLAQVGLSYNCSGQTVEALQVGTGEYEVVFVGNPALIAMATVNPEHFDHDEFATVETQSPGTWIVVVWSTLDGKPIDDRVGLLVP